MNNPANNLPIIPITNPNQIDTVYANDITFGSTGVDFTILFTEIRQRPSSDGTSMETERIVRAHITLPHPCLQHLSVTSREMQMKVLNMLQAIHATGSPDSKAN